MKFISYSMYWLIFIDPDVFISFTVFRYLLCLYYSHAFFDVFYIFKRFLSFCVCSICLYFITYLQLLLNLCCHVSVVCFHFYYFVMKKGFLLVNLVSFLFSLVLSYMRNFHLKKNTSFLAFLLFSAKRGHAKSILLQQHALDVH